jgi:hypothetical protein
MDFEMMCETIARKIFQCGRFDDPLGRLANTDQWSGLYDDEFSTEHKCKAWAVLARLQNQYLDSVSGREELYEQSENIEERILNATTNQELINLMLEINQIVEALDIQEFPHIDYQKTNDNK